MIIVVGGEKGGTGKTTLATNLAVLRRDAGHDVLLLDADPQGSANNWSQFRLNTDLNPIPCLQKLGNIKADIADLKTRYGDIFIDTGGRNSEELRSALVVADVFITPIQPSQFDIWSLSTVNELVKIPKLLNPAMKSYVVASRSVTNTGQQELMEMRSLLVEFPELTLLRTIIRDRVAFRKAAKFGKVVTELLPEDKKASEEISAMYIEVFG